MREQVALRLRRPATVVRRHQREMGASRIFREEEGSKRQMAGRLSGSLALLSLGSSRWI